MIQSGCDKSVPVFRRRPVQLLTSGGQFQHPYENPVGDGLIRLEVPVGSIRWSRKCAGCNARCARRSTKGPPVEVSEAELEQAPPLATILTAGQATLRITGRGD